MLSVQCNSRCFGSETDRKRLLGILFDLASADGLNLDVSLFPTHYTAVVAVFVQADKTFIS